MIITMKMKNKETLLGDEFFNKNKWDEEAPYYALMNELEARGTDLEIACLPLKSEYTVLDLGCGPGRMTVPIAKKTKKVYATDFSEKMIEICRENCARSKAENVDCFVADWQNPDDDALFPEVDVIVQARWSGGCSTLEKYQKKARKYVVIIEWMKNPPRMARDLLFQNCFSEQSMELHPELRPFDAESYSSKNLSKTTKEIRDQQLKDKLRDSGITVHKNVVEEGWLLYGDTKEEIVETIIKLSRYPELVIRENFEKNLTNYMSQESGRWKFYMPTWSKVEWFKTR